MFSILGNASLKDVETRPIAYWVLTDTVYTSTVPTDTVYTSTVPSQHRRLKDVDNATEINVLNSRER